MNPGSQRCARGGFVGHQETGMVENEKQAIQTRNGENDARQKTLENHNIYLLNIYEF